MTSTAAALALVRDDLERVEQELQLVAQTEHPLLGPMLSMVLPGAGKRLRPALAFLSGRFGEPDDRAMLDMAVGVELLHTASLVHDDVVDDSELRRGSATLFTKVGNALAVLVGDYLFAQSATRCVATCHIRVISLFAETLASMCQGQIEEASRGNRPELRLTPSDYYQTVWGKTASLFVLACEGGALLAGLPEDQVQALRSYGEQIGLAFQLADDILDFVGSQSELGKPVGSDLRQGTITLPVIYLREEIANGHFAQLFEEGPDRVVAAVQGSNALNRCYAEADEYVSRAISALDALPATREREALSQLAQFSVQRRT
ncbi:MAG: polyprenyl synthetase family protein [Chloroflexi bacterium]|nr:polyprenyl synthetase family protein [Chloroflexota bacterium]